MRTTNRRETLQLAGGALAWPVMAGMATAIGAGEDAAKPRIKIGQIGVGHAHASKLSVYRASADYEVVGIVEPDAKLRQQAETQAVYKDLPWMTREQLLNVPGLQAVLVETRVHDLLDTAETCIAAGKHIHLDKPAGESLPQFRRILDAAAKQKLLVQMGYMYRYNPAVVLLREFLKRGWLVDSYLVDIATGQATNVTAVERVSFYNSVFFWPADPTKLGLTALVDGSSKPFRMDRDGRNKVDLNKDSKGFVYGFSSSRDGSRIAYHENYQVYLADAAGSHRNHVQTGQPFNFAPTWSPDGLWVLFVSGEHYNCHPHIDRADGTGLKKLADRGGYRGVIEFLDVFDFRGGSSDTPV